MTDLSHYGVKGMRWGVRRQAGEQQVSSDAARAGAARTKAKTQGKQALSNEEMQALVTRMNLERQLAQVTPPSNAQKATRFIAGTLQAIGKTQAQRIANEVVAQQVDKQLRAIKKK